MCVLLQEENKQKRREIERELRHIAGLDSTTIEAVERQLKAAVSQSVYGGTVKLRIYDME